RFFGIWINGSSATYVNVPSFYAVHLSAPLEDMALPQVLQKEQVGLENLHLAEIAPDDKTNAGNEDFREAFLRLRSRQGLYAQSEGTVEFLSQSLFRTTVPLPATVPDGEYEMTVYLFRGGGLLTKETRPLSIAKSGFEQFTYSFAHNYSLFYGIVTVLLAAFTGWAASVIFRKD
ncbi:MAG: TIGR02186 family protein, partial [Stappiaceae bacterium]